MNTRAHIATEQNLAECQAVRLELLERLAKALRPEEAWCPAGVPIPWIPDEEGTSRHFTGSTEHRWALVIEGQDTIKGCLLLQTVMERREVVIQGHQPWLSPSWDDKERIAELVSRVIALARSAGMERVTFHFHGPARQVLPLADAHRSLGFDGGIRLEMVTRDFEIDLGRRGIQFRTAGEIGEKAYHEAEVAVSRFGSVDESKEDCAFSRRMWSVDPATDWIVAYLGSEPVATTRVAIAKNRIGVVDDVTVVKTRRNQGIGGAVLARALRTLKDRTDAVWADTDEDNKPAVRLNLKLGLQVQHCHGVMTLNMR